MRAILFVVACLGVLASSAWCAAQDTRKERLTLRGHTQLINSLAFSPDGKTLASAGWDKKILLWDVNTGQNIATLEGHTMAAWALAFSPDGKILASTGTDDTVRVWDWTSGKNTATLEHRFGMAFSIVFAPDKKTVVFGCPGCVKQWDMQSPKAKDLLLLDSGTDPTIVANTQAGLWALGGGDAHTKSIWNVARKEMTGKLTPIPAGYRTAAFSPEGTMLATADFETNVDLWECATAKHKATFKLPAQTTCLTFSPDGGTCPF
jgi:WD40 repeat protein